MKIVLQHTRGAFGNVRDIPEGQWINGPEYRKVRTAREGLQKALAEMRERCGRTAWDSHYRLVNAGVLPIKLTAHIECYGSYWTKTRQHATDCHRGVFIEWMWEPGEPEPHMPRPEGWHSNTCPACHVLDEDFVRREYERA